MDYYGGIIVISFYGFGGLDICRGNLLEVVYDLIFFLFRGFLV